MSSLRRRTATIGLLAALLAGAFLLARVVGSRGGGSSVPSAADPGLPVYAAEEAAAHVGERARVCGHVADAAYPEGVRGRPTFLNFVRPYPDQPFTAVIWGRDRSKFGRPEVAYLNARLCVAGTIREHEGTPRIELREPRQLRVVSGPR